MLKIQILGTGCRKCEELTRRAEEAAAEAGVEYELEKVTQIDDIIALGVMTTPGLIVDGEIKCVGKLPSPEAIKAMLTNPEG